MSLSLKKIAEIELCYDIGSDFPDGAWWGLLEEHGVDVEDLVAYWEERKKKVGNHEMCIRIPNCDCECQLID